MNPSGGASTLFKESRLDKWLRMVAYGLDEDLARKAVLSIPKRSDGEIRFNKQYALTGLSNFFETYPQVFLCRLSKGPPPQFRWLAWQVVAS